MGNLSKSIFTAICCLVLGIGVGYLAFHSSQPAADPYIYGKLDNGMSYRTNKLTGVSQIASYDGWKGKPVGAP